jgi:UDP-glucose 4-epimerase
MIKYFLISGGCGFIGLSVVDYLLTHFPGCHIRVLDNFHSGTAKDLAGVCPYELIYPGHNITSSSGVFLLQGDIRDSEICNFATKGVQCVIHLAANTGVGPSVDNPRLDLDCNVIGTFNMLEASRGAGVDKFIFASSGAPVGDIVPPIHEEVPAHPVSPYGASKLAGEGYCSAYYKTFGLNTVCLRFGNVYGPRSSKKSSVVARFIRQGIAGETCYIFGDGLQTRDFIYVDDLVGAVIKAIENPVGGEVFQIATGKEHNVAEVAEIIKALLANRGIDMNVEYGTARLGDVMRNYSDTSKAFRMLGWKSTMDVSVGIEKTIDWFLSA